MRLLTLGLAFLLLGAAPAPVTLPIGTFQTWHPADKAPLDFTSGGVTVHVEALPCPPKPVGEGSCRWDSFNNQGAVTIRAPGVAPFRVRTDGASFYARIAVVRFDRRDSRPGVIVESQSGGSGGDMSAQLLIPDDATYRVLRLGRSDRPDVQGQLADAPQDLSGDGRIDLRLTDAAFDSAFGCNACTPRPPRLFAVIGGKVVDESREQTLRHVFAADMARLAPICLSQARYRNGACAAYVADAARAGRFDAAWAAMLEHYEHEQPQWEPCQRSLTQRNGKPCPAADVIRFPDFPHALHAFLQRTGYLSS